MVRKFALAVVVVAAVMLPVATRADFISGYTDWQRLSPQARQGYVMGGLGQLLSNRGAGIGGNRTAGMFWRAGLNICLAQRLQITSGMMEQAVTDAYRANPDLWRVPAASMVEYVATRMCEPDINMALRQANEPLIGANFILEDMRAFAKLMAEMVPQQQQPSRRR